MRTAPNERVERLRVDGPDGTNYGAFILEHRGQKLRVIASAGGGWDHVSVSRPDRCPTWAEMDYVKRQFFHDDEVVMQLHVARTDHINNHPFCLHLWRPQTADQISSERAATEAAGECWPYGDLLPSEIPLPPGWMVGLKVPA